MTLEQVRRVKSACKAVIAACDVTERKILGKSSASLSWQSVCESLVAKVFANIAILIPSEKDSK